MLKALRRGFSTRAAGWRRVRYTEPVMRFAVPVARRRTPPLTVLLCAVLAAIVLSVGALPSAWLWRCRHTGQIVSSRFAELPTRMPCGMRLAGDSVPDASLTPSTPEKPCCHRRGNDSGPTYSAPTKCGVAFVQALLLPAAHLPGGDIKTPVPSVFDLEVIGLPPVSTVGGLTPAYAIDRPRPPPLPVPHRSPVERPGFPGLRAPPAFA